MKLIKACEKDSWTGMVDIEGLELTPGEDVLFGYLPWNGEDSINYYWKDGVLFTNDKVVGIHLQEHQPTSWFDTKDIIFLVNSSFTKALLQEFPNLRALSLSSSTLQELKRVSRLKHLRCLNLSDTFKLVISENKLKVLSRIQTLRELVLVGCNFKASSYKHFSVFLRLRGLDLRDSNITDDGLEYIRDISTLQKLDLNNTLITDKGVVYLQELQNLVHLSLADTVLTDESVKALLKLINLRELDLRGTCITKSGVIQLKKLKKLKFLIVDSEVSTP